jgi:hypothetical protein
MMLPASVDALGVSYSEVLFTDTSTNDWFTVPRASPFYLHNYHGSCGDSMDYQDTNFPVSARSSGSGQLHADWANGCPNNSDMVTTQGTNCTDIFVLFDTTCSGSSTVRVQAYVR